MIFLFNFHTQNFFTFVINQHPFRISQKVIYSTENVFQFWIYISSDFNKHFKF